MTKPRPKSELVPESMAARPWSVPIALSEVPEIGRHFDLVADRHVRAAIAKLAGLDALPRLAAAFDVTLYGRSGLHVVGRVAATVGQTCVLTLESIENEIDEPIDVVFTSGAAHSEPQGGEVEIPAADEPEVLVDGAVDLGAIATEFLLLAVDPYPRKPGAVFQAPAAGDESPRPFQALAALKERRRKSQGDSKD